MLISTEPSGRTEVRSAIGSTMLVKVTRRGRPLTSAASRMPLSMARMPARIASEAKAPPAIDSAITPVVKASI